MQGFVVVGSASRVFVSACVVKAALFGIAHNAAAQSFPTNQITIVVPFAAGGPSDTMARLLAEGMSGPAGARVLVENVAGAGGATGSARVAKAMADGHTLVFGNIGTHAANTGLFKKLAYDPVTDFEPVAIIANVPLIVSTRKALPVTSFADFVALTKSKPGDLTFASAGIGSASHLGCLLLDAAIGGKARHVPYRGAGPALNDLVAGQVDFMCDQAITMMPQISGGTIRPLATLSAKRLDTSPDLPTVSEQRIAGVEVEVWNAIFAPKGTPAPTVAKLVEMIDKALVDGIGRRLVEFGATIPARDVAGPAALKALVAAEGPRWRDALKSAGVAAE